MSELQNVWRGEGPYYHTGYDNVSILFFYTIKNLMTFYNAYDALALLVTHCVVCGFCLNWQCWVGKWGYKLASLGLQVVTFWM